MRELSIQEMDLVAGGNVAFIGDDAQSLGYDNFISAGGQYSTSSDATTVAALVVVGNKNVMAGPNLVLTSEGLLWDDPMDTGRPEVVYDLSFLDVPPEICQNKPTTPAEKQAKVDGMAAQIARIIESYPEHTTREYGAIIYQGTDGLIHSTPISSGEAGTVACNMTGLLNYGQILAVVHSHPLNGHAATGAWVDQNKHPSLIMYDEAGVPYGDTIAFNEFVSHGVNVNTFSNYIIGPDDGLRKYNKDQMTTGVITSALDKSMPICETLSA
jgi:hypothetical protein